MQPYKRLLVFNTLKEQMEEVNASAMDAGQY